VKNQSKDKRKIEIQQNLQKMRDNSLVIRESANLKNSGTITDDTFVCLITDSTLEQNLQVDNF